MDNYKLQFLNTKKYDNENDNSNVIYLNYNNYKFLFMGDAGIEREKDILEKIICLAPRPDLMQQFFYLRGISKKSMAEYLLKYSYVENWNTEINEKYLDVDWIIIKYFETEEVKPEETVATENSTEEEK